MKTLLLLLAAWATLGLLRCTKEDAAKRSQPLQRQNGKSPKLPVALRLGAGGNGSALMPLGARTYLRKMLFVEPYPSLGMPQPGPARVALRLPRQ